MNGKVHLEDAGGGVRVMRLADADRRNAIDRRMRDDMAEATRAVASDPAARVLVLRADGPAFCSGADVVETFGGAAEKTIDTLRDELGRVYEVILGIRALAIPTIAAIRGPAVGAGMNIALACDVRIAAPDASFGATFSRIGLHPGGGCSYFLAQALGPQRALRVLLDGATLDARAALEGRLVDQVAEDPEAVALEIAARWATLEPELSRAIKRSIRLAVSAGLEASMEFESWAQAASARKPRVAEIVEQRRARTGAKGAMT